MTALKISCVLLLLMNGGCADAPANLNEAMSETAATSGGSISPTSSTSTEPAPTDASTGTLSEPAGSCGDGVVNGDEACDDGNAIDGDACTNVCAAATCGDGIVGPGEGCDDGNLDDNDRCTSNCVLASCGDSIVQSGEDCDEGSGTPTCDVNCTAVACGDGDLNPIAGEICDEGDMNAGDACSRTCTPTKIMDLAVGGEFVCIAFETGAVRCWGQGEYGVMANGETDDKGNEPDELPTADIPLDGPVKGLAAGLRHVCALLTTDVVQCWGYDEHGEAGKLLLGVSVGDQPGEMPPPTIALPLKATAIAAGVNHSCAIVEGGTVRCWGSTGNGATGLSTLAKDVKGISDAAQLALGYNFSCARTTSGEVRCWGLNDVGQLGLGHTNNIDTDVELPPPAVDLGGDVAIAIDAGTAHVCALLQGGTMRCWGIGSTGALGNGLTTAVGTTPESLPPPPVLLEGVEQIATGRAHTCAIVSSGAVHCWGDCALNGCLGYGDTNKHIMPPEMAVELGFGVTAVKISASIGYFVGNVNLGMTTCAFLSDDTLRCWGNNSFGQLGLGHVDVIGDDETPVDVKVPY